MLWVRKKKHVSMRRFFCAATTYVKIDGLENIYNFMLKFFVYQNLWMTEAFSPFLSLLSVVYGKHTRVTILSKSPLARALLVEIIHSCLTLFIIWHHVWEWNNTMQ